MKRRLLDRLPMLLVRAAGAMVPRADRAEWVAEWAGELWQVSSSRQDRRAAQVESIRFSLGAVCDAFLMGWNGRCLMARFAPGTAARCLLILGSIALAGILACRAIPGARTVLAPLPYRDLGNVALISRFGAVGREVPSIYWSEYNEWTSDTASLYQQIAYYAPEAATLHIRHQRAARLVVAVASGSLLEVLQIRGAGVAGSGHNATGPQLLLTQSAWKRWYHRDRSLLGDAAEVRGQNVTVAGVIPDKDWRLPVSVDAVLLEDAAGSEGLPPSRMGFVVARIWPQAFPADSGGQHSMVETRDGMVKIYACVSLEALTWEPAQALACCIVLALLALPVITALSLGEYPIAREALRIRLVIRRWLFIAAKFVLMVTIVGAWSSAIVFGFGGRDMQSAAGHLVMVAFVPLLFGFRWVLYDQRRRCPICMRRLSHPARVGQASWSFLGWCGTEMICAKGHGLLHIAELPTSWFGTQRWLGLDPSWLSLFADGTAPHSLAANSE